MTKIIPDTAKMTAVGRLAGGVAHDYNNILGAIEGYASLVSASLKPGEQMRQDLDEIRKAVSRGSAFSRLLFIFSLKNPPPDQASSAAAAAESLRGEETALAALGIKLVLEVSPDLPQVAGSQEQLNLAMAHLLSNARDAMPGGGEARVSAALKDGLVELAVSDTGAGVPQEAQPFIFEPFFTTKEKGKGKGLGLTLVYGIARLRGGRVEAETETGKGSRFAMLLPPARKT